MFFRHGKKVIGAFAAVMLLTVLYVAMQDDVFASDAKLLVRLGHENVALDPTATTGQTVNVSYSIVNEIRSAMEILQSRDLAEGVVDAIGVERIKGREVEESAMAAQREACVAKLMKKLSVLSDESRVIDVSYEAGSPDLAHDVVATFVDLYLTKHIAVHQNPGAYDFFEAQAQTQRELLEDAEARLEDLKAETGIADIEQSRTDLITHVGELQTSRRQADVSLAAANARLGAIQHALDTLSDAIASGKGIPHIVPQAIQERLVDLVLQEQQQLANYPDDSRSVQAIREQIAEARALIEQEARHDLTTKLFAEQTQASALDAERTAIDAQLATASQELAALVEGETRIQALNREIEILDASYRKYSDNLEQARIDRELEAVRISSVTVVQPASFIATKVGPSRVRSLAVGFILALLFAMCIALAAEYLDHSIRTPQDVEERLGLPVLAAVPQANTPRVGPVKSRNREKTPTRWGLGDHVLEPFEAFSNRLTLGVNGADLLPRVVAVTGGHRGEGVSTVAANLAYALARQHDGSVVLIDGDVRRPTVHRIFERPLAPGLTEAIAGDNGVSAVGSSPIANLNVLSAGKRNGRHLDISRFGEILESARRRWRYVIVDLPPVHETKTAARLASLCDGVVQVVEAESQPWEVAHRATNELVSAHAQVLGVVLNKRRYPVPDWLYRRL